MRKIVQPVADFIYRILASDKFFVVLLGVFILQAVWLAFTAIYPMPFDEYAHVGAIQLYAQQWSWIVTEQPLNTGIIGDLTREPSFLYRWLMSYPYRALDNFLSVDQTIIAMRLMNVAMVAGGLALFRRLLREWGLSRRIINVVLLAFVMTPIVPFLAAHVNYDNLMFLLTPVVFLYATRIIKTNEGLVQHLAFFLLIGATASLAKQTFLPIMAIVTSYLAWVVLRRNGRKVFQIFRKSWQETPKNLALLVIIFGLVAVSIMAVERYGRNLVRYGTVRPKCQVVQPVQLCEDFGPWYRDNVVNAQNRPAEPPYGNELSFSQYWVSRMMRGYFAIFQHTPTQAVWEKEPYGPIVSKPLLPANSIFACFVAIAGLFAVIWQRRKIWESPYLRFALVVSSVYALTMWAFNYSSYLRLWKAEAIQARYTYPLMILVFALVAWAINKSITRRQIKAWLVVAMLVFYVWGGGIAGWLIRADDTWRWQHPLVQDINHTAQNILRFTVIH